ncbi:MAG: PEFG-CTERM sorting domain-containing protein [Candidatus Nitrosopumilus sp. bin_32a]
MKIIIPILLIALVIIPTYAVFAESAYDINIPSGSADKNAPFHWSSEKDGDTSGFIEIIVGDTIFWKNADTVSHTVTSGNPQAGLDGIFDSKIIESGKFFKKTFDEIGEFEYYCTIHPWRTGLVSVVSGFSMLSDVGIDAGDGMTLFDVEYKFNRVVNEASVIEESKSILLKLKGNTINDDNTLTLLLPTELISGINSISIDGKKTGKFSQEFNDGMVTLEVKEIPPKAKTIIITGAAIVPEFGTIAAMILAVAILSLIAVTAKSRIISKLN